MQFIKDYKNDTSWGRVAASFLILLNGALSLIVVLKTFSVEHPNTALPIIYKIIVANLIAAGCYYLISKYPELWSKLASKLIDWKLGGRSATTNDTPGKSN